MKNWTVISKPIKESSKGLANYLNYLIDVNHKNHKNKTRIIPILGNSEKLYKKIVYSVAERDLIRSKKRKGGRTISSYAQSYVFTLPENLPKHPTHEDWKYIAVDLIKTIQKFTNIPFQELKSNIFINLHDQKNPHLNVVVSKVMDKSVKTELQKKSIVSALKKAFNFSVMKRINLSPNDYQPKTKRSKRFNDFIYKDKKMLENCDEILLKKIAASKNKSITINTGIKT